MNLSIGLGLPSVVVSGGRGCAPVDQIDGDLVEGATFTHPADGVIAYTVTTVPSASSLKIRFRVQDASNYWLMAHFSGGILLQEVVTGVATTRANSETGVLVNGSRVVIVCNGSTITVYSDDTERATYASATNFAAETDGEYNDSAIGGVVSDLKTWTLACRGQEGV